MISERSLRIVASFQLILYPNPSSNINPIFQAVRGSV